MEALGKKIVFILSTNYSGSHYLSLLIGSHSQATHLGEVKNLVKLKNVGASGRVAESTRQCHLCGGNAGCRLFNDIHAIDRGGVYSELFRRAGTPLLVDASKKIAWARQFPACDDYDVAYVHLLRHPAALVRKWQMQYDTAKKAMNQRVKEYRRSPGKIATLVAPQWRIYLKKWLRQNRAISDFLSVDGRNGYVLSYHDLSLHTAREVDGLMRWLGLAREQGQLDYWNHEHHGSQKPRYAETEKGESFIDLRWQQEMPAAVQAGARQDAAISAYLELLGFHLEDNGIVRNA